MTDNLTSPTRKRGEDDVKPIRYEDFAIPSPFVQPWMTHYLPAGSRLRDFVVMCMGNIICAVFGIILYEFTASELLAVSVALGGAGYFQFDMMWRTLLAGMNYGKAKRNERRTIQK